MPTQRNIRERRRRLVGGQYCNEQGTVMNTLYSKLGEHRGKRQIAVNCVPPGVAFSRIQTL
jgi:hypothetical protein